MKRKCGVLLPISSLPSKWGIGGFSEEAYRFVEFLERAGQSFWQILPMGQTGYGDSPYQSFSTFAGNPYFIDPGCLVRDGYLTDEDLREADCGQQPRYADYGALYSKRYALLRKAYRSSPFTPDRAGEEAAQPLNDFIERKKEWLPDYALYNAIKQAHGGQPFIEWEEELRTRDPEALGRCREELADEIRFWEFTQFEFDREWTCLKSYTNEHGIRIIGDMTIYVAFDSADTWSHPELFELDEKGFPTMVAGVPPDGFTADGQLWGNPIYRWDYHRETGYAWWISRLREAFHLYDTVRIDHFRGFDEYYVIPYGDEHARRGTWRPGPGMDLFRAVKEALGERDIIAEDLGYQTPTVAKLVKDSGFPGMKVLQFAFDSREESDYLPHTYPRNCVVYTGTHDNETTAGWYADLEGEDKLFAQQYADITPDTDPVDRMIRLAFMSVADTAIIPMMDYLGLGNEARLNHPSTLGGNWSWRMLPGEADEALARRMKDLARLYGRDND